MTFNPIVGAQNLLQNCIAAHASETLLIVGEEYGVGYYDDQVCDFIATQAQSLGIKVSILRAPAATGPDDIPASVITAMQEVDHTLFLARLGDQIRFSETHGSGSKTMCYALDMEYLGSEFACTPWQLYKRVHDQLLDAILSADHYHISCPLGTQLVGKVPKQIKKDNAFTNFTVKVFPVVM